MATRSIKTRLELENEANYKQSLKEISSGMSVLKSEMNKVSAEFKGNEQSVEALTAKNDVLNRQILTQKERVEVLRQALQEAANAYGESDTRTDSFKVKLNNAEAELAKMEGQLKDNNAALETAAGETEKTEKAFEKFGDSSKGLGDVLQGVAQKLGVSIPDGATDALNRVTKLEPRVAAAAAAFSAIVAAIVEAEKKLYSGTLKSGEFADSMNTLALQTGVNTETLQEWSYASELIDVDLNTLTSSLSKLTRNMNSARNGNADLTDAFGQLGVSITDNVTGKLRDNEDVFADVIDALGNISEDTERDALAMTIFGKSAQELNTLIVQGSETLRAYTDEAHDNALLLSGEQLQALQAVDDAQQRLLKTQESVSNQISAEYAPYMTDALDATRDGVTAIGKAITDSGAVEALGSILTSTASLIAPLIQLGAEVIPVISAALSPLAGTLAWIADTVNVIVSLLTWNPTLFSTAMGMNPNEASNLQKWQYGADYKTSSYAGNNGAYYNAATGMYEGNYYNASGNDNFAGGMTWVGENGPELVSMPYGSRIYPAQESRSMGGDTFNITISAQNVREFNDLIEIANNARRHARMGGTV